MINARKFIRLYFSYIKDVPPEELYRAHMLYAIVALASLCMIFLLVYATVAPPDDGVFQNVILALSLSLVPTMILLRRQRWRAVTYFIIVSIWSAISYGALISAGIYSSGIVIYTLPLIIAALLLNNRSLIIVLIVTITFLAYLMLTEITGMVVYSTDRLPVYRFVITVVAGISISVALAYNKNRLQEAEKQNRELFLEQEIARIQNEYSQSLVHDLRTPLSVMKTQTYLIQRRIEDGESIANNLGQINNYVDKLSRMVDDFAHVSELTGFTPILTNQMVDLEDIIESTIGTLQHLCSEKNVHIHVIKAFGGTKLHIPGHGDYLKQMFRHLIQNSIQFSPPNGEVTLTLSADDGNVCSVIKDEGIGINPEQQDHIFDMFYRGNEARTMEIDTGSGIGLAITKRIVDLHQGSISVKSEVNKGTTFTILLPTSQS